MWDFALHIWYFSYREIVNVCLRMILIVLIISATAFAFGCYWRIEFPASNLNNLWKFSDSGILSLNIQSSFWCVNDVPRHHVRCHSDDLGGKLWRCHGKCASFVQRSGNSHQIRFRSIVRSVAHKYFWFIIRRYNMYFFFVNYFDYLDDMIFDLSGSVPGLGVLDLSF